jgi:PAS domain S-box-containing protein
MAFESGADDYLATPPDVIELRKRVRLYLDRADLESRVRSETRLTQEMDAIARRSAEEADSAGPLDDETVSLLQHVATLTTERDLLHQILYYASEAIIFIDTDGIVRFVNPAWERLDGRAAALVLGEQMEDWPPQADDPVTTRAIREAVEAGNGWQGELSYVLPNKRHLDVAMTISPAYDAEYRLTGFVVVQRDVAARRAMDTLKTRFLSDASVEMRTPVTNIKMRQYLMRQAPPDQREMHVQALERETERLSNMVDSMLELSRMDSGVVQFACEDVNLNRLLADALVRYGPSAEEKGVTLASRRNEDEPVVTGDPAYLSRALGLLVENAILYTPESGHVELRLGREDWTGGEFATVYVSDTGMGIEQEALPHVFERFYRADRVRDSGIRGVGLGLAIAHEILRRHNGDITVDSQVGKGSTFTMWLPI